MHISILLKKLQNNQYLTSFYWSFVEKIYVMFIQFLSILIFSRELQPKDFGIIGIITVFINISAMLVDSGMVGALIGKKEVTDLDYSTLFFFNLLVSIVLYIILFILSKYIALFYKIDIIKNIIRILSLTIIINSFGIIQLVQLTRKLRFKTISIITLISQSLSLLIGLYLLFNKYGIYSIVYMQLSQSIVNTLELIIVNKYIPLIGISKKSFIELFEFGYPLLISNIVNILNNNIVITIMGKFFSITDVGYFTQSLKLQNVPINIVSSVIDKAGFTILSKKENKELIYHGMKIKRTLYYILIPVYLFIILNAKEIYLTVLSKEWENGEWIFESLLLSLFPMTIKAIERNIIKSSGNTKIIMKMEAVSLIINIIITIISATISFKVLIYNLIISNIILSIICIFYTKMVVKDKDYFQSKYLIKPIIISVIGYCILFYLKKIIKFGGLLTIIVTMLIYFLYIFFLYQKILGINNENNNK